MGPDDLLGLNIRGVKSVKKAPEAAPIKIKPEEAREAFEKGIIGDREKETHKKVEAVLVNSSREFEKAREFLKEVVADVSALKLTPQPKLARVNRHLEVRNRALLLFKSEVERGFSPALKSLRDFLDRPVKPNTDHTVILRELEEKSDKAASLQGKVFDESKVPTSDLQRIQENFPSQIGLGSTLAEVMTRMQLNSATLPLNPSLVDKKGLFTGDNFTPPEDIASGAFGAVYKAEEKLTGKSLAVKSSINPEHMKEAKAEFDRTKKLIGQPHILVSEKLLQVDDPRQSFGFPKGTLILTMPFSDGLPPQEALKAGEKRMIKKKEMIGRDLEQVVTVAQQMAEALDATHRAGLVHADVKPENILIENTDGKLNGKLCDWGSAVEIGIESKNKSTTYTSPEALPDVGFDEETGLLKITKPAEVSTPSQDIYALGVTLYVLLTGDIDPFEVNEMHDTLKSRDKEISEAELSALIMKEAKSKKKSPKENPFSTGRLQQRGVTGPIATIIESATAPNPRDRFPSKEGPSMKVMKEALEKLGERKITKAFEAGKAKERVARDSERLAALNAIPNVKVDPNAAQAEKNAARRKLYYG